MRHLLSRLPAQRILSLIPHQQLAAMRKMLGAHSMSRLASEPGAATDCVIELFGTGLLNDRKARQLVLEALGPDQVSSLHREYCKSSARKFHDQVFALARVRWAHGSPFVAEFARVAEVPREYLPRARQGRAVVDEIEPVSVERPLHDYQIELRDRSIEQLRSAGSAFLLQMPTGSGKTRTILEAVVQHICDQPTSATIGRSVLWLAHTEELCEQAIDSFVSIWQRHGNRNINVVRCWGVYRPSEIDFQDSFVVASYQTLHSLLSKRKRTYDALADSVAIVIADEAHKILAVTYHAALLKLQSPETVLVGLTATPGRGLYDELANVELTKLFDSNLIRLELGDNPINVLQDRGILSRLVRRTVESGCDLQPEMAQANRGGWSSDISSAALARLAADQGRNRKILECVIDEVRASRPTLVFCCSTEHARALAGALVVNGIPARFVDCELNRGARRAAIDEFRNGTVDVLLNFGVLSTGFDAPRIRSVIITRPTTSVVLYSQMIGRGLRGPLMGGTPECQLIDVVDNFQRFGEVDTVYGCFDEYWS